MQRRVTQLPLHNGKAPSWLFKRMAKLAGAVTMAVVDAYGSGSMRGRLSDPWWFQAFGCVLGFDWHSSGLTTVTCGALKEAQIFLGTPDVGPATVCSLSLLAELIHDAPASRRDPAVVSCDADVAEVRPGRRWADYSYAHGGKDGTPFPVDRQTFDQKIAVLTAAVRQARLGETDKRGALRRLARFDQERAVSSTDP